MMGRNTEIGCALKDREMRSLLGNHGNGLDCRRAGTDDANSIAGEIDLFVRPLSGVVGLTFVAFQALEIRSGRGRKTACGHDAVFGRNMFAAVGFYRPAVGSAVERNNSDTGIELHLPSQIKFFYHAGNVLEDLRLPGVALRPRPLTL